MRLRSDLEGNACLAAPLGLMSMDPLCGVRQVNARVEVRADLMMRLKNKVHGTKCRSCTITLIRMKPLERARQSTWTRWFRKLEAGPTCYAFVLLKQCNPLVVCGTWSQGDKSEPTDNDC